MRHPKITIPMVVVSLLYALFVWGQVAPRPGNAQGPKSGSQSKPPVTKEPSTPAMSDQVMNIPYYTIRDGLNSMLTLNNVAASPTTVSVTLFNMEGHAQGLDPISLAPNSIQQIELADVIKNKDFTEGNIRITYHGIPMIVTSQISVFSTNSRIGFESREQDMPQTNSPRFDLCWSANQRWLPAHRRM